MQHTFRDTDEADAEIACFETEDGLMTLQIDGRDFKLSKARFIEFSTMLHRVGQILIDEMIDERLSRHPVLGLEV